LDIINDGNGDVNASELTAIKAVVEKYGNGDIQVNVLNELQVTSRGNGDIINRGKADFVVKALSGNGKLLKKN
jgi:dissimilatory sulfite reductase (desulfoviridin) alpha/beta subunit